MGMEIWEWKHGNGNTRMAPAMTLTCADVQQVAVGTACVQDDLESSLKYLGGEKGDALNKLARSVS